jgi:hypothetical protein
VSNILSYLEVNKFTVSWLPCWVEAWGPGSESKTVTYCLAGSLSFLSAWGPFLPSKSHGSKPKLGRCCSITPSQLRSPSLRKTPLKAALSKMPDLCHPSNQVSSQIFKGKASSHWHKNELNSGNMKSPRNERTVALQFLLFYLPYMGVFSDTNPQDGQLNLECC